MFGGANLIKRHKTVSLVDRISNCTSHINDGVIGICKLCTTLPFSEELNEVHTTFIGVSYKGIIM